MGADVTIETPCGMDPNSIDDAITRPYPTPPKKVGKVKAQSAAAASAACLWCWDATRLLSNEI
jgi:hypothetical protein